MRPVLVWMQASHARPGRVALAWGILTILLIVDAMFFPYESSEGMSSALMMSAVPVFGGLLAGWALRLRSSALGLVAMLCSLGISLEAVWLVYKFWAVLRSYTPVGMQFVPLEGLALSGVALWFGYRQRSRIRRLAAIALVVGTHIFALGFVESGELFWQASAQAQALVYPDIAGNDTADIVDVMAKIPADRLWPAQPDLMAKELDTLRPHVAGQTNVYAIGVAADGRQQVFSREAQLALKVAALRFGNGYRGGVLLSNGLGDLLNRPLATEGHIAMSVRGAAQRGDPANDVILIYLASHGSREASLSTSLPNYQDLTPITVKSLAETLAKEGITRRIVIISACYSGSWIPALANDNTIIITASAKDRTSFGCDDTRRLTYFGEALLTGPLARGASLRDSFDEARKKVAAWEAKENLVPSLPQAFVGRNMQTLWAAQVPDQGL